MHKNKGFTIIEIAIALFLLSLLFYSFVEVAKDYFSRTKKTETQIFFRDLDKALKLHMEKVFSYRRTHNWELADDCSYERAWVVPNGCWSDDTNYLYIWKDNELLDAFVRANCKLVEATDKYYKLQCLDGFKTPLRFEFKNINNSHTVPYDFKTPIEIKIISAGKDKQFGTDDDITYIFTTAVVDNEYSDLTYNQLQKIRKALDSYFRYRFSVEVIERTYPDGLAEADDMKVDWYLQLCTDVPYEYCQDDSCSNIAGHWPTSPHCGGDTQINTCYLATVLKNLNLPEDYQKDAFGNPLYINLCFDANGDGYPTGDSPSAHDDKGPFISTISNGVLTIVSSGE